MEYFGFAGFTNGPRRLKKFSSPTFFKGPTDFNAGWKSGAWIKQILAFSRSFFKSSDYL
jgi:hypothetical protein